MPELSFRSLLFAEHKYLAIGNFLAGGGVPPYNGLMGTCGQPGYVFRDFCLQKSEFCLKQGRKISDICLKQGQGMRGRAAPPHPGIYRVPPPPLRASEQGLEQNISSKTKKYFLKNSTTENRLLF